MPSGLHDHLLMSEGDMELLFYLQSLMDIGFNDGLALDLYKYNYEEVATESIKYFNDLIARL